MNVNEYGAVTFNSLEALDSIYNLNSDIINFLDDQKEIEKYNEFCSTFDIPQLDMPQKISEDIFEYHKRLSSNWNMPQEYKDINIEEHLTQKLIDLKLTEAHYIQILADEINEYKNRNMLDLLKFLKYMMDICTQNDIVTGVGRGSSVASLVLYLLGIHVIDPIKYNLDYKEFLR